MNKRELIEHINNTLFDNLKDTLFTEPTLSITESAKDNKMAITFETEQGGALVGGMLKKFEKVTIPQFVADWIDNVKRNGLKQKNNFGFFEEITSNDSAYRVTYYIIKEGIATKDIRKWVGNNTDAFARAWLDGYEVEKENRYLVKMKGVNDSYCVLTHYEDGNRWIMGTITNNYISCKLHTKKQLEDAGFGWVFDCPGIEIEEVE